MELGCLLKDERTCTMKLEVENHICRVMTRYVWSAKNFIWTVVSQFLLFLQLSEITWIVCMKLFKIVLINGKCVCIRYLGYSQSSTRNNINALTFLTGSWEEGTAMSSHPVTENKTLVDQIPLQQKHSLSHKKFKQTVSTRKIICIKFWDRHHILWWNLFSKTQQQILCFL